ncbi:MFS family permease [Microbacterium ginsengiterrae]|uniref:MFS family permease n=1 Tax=Microbacterium ginsengiterrae TaxID=546115 RepID=A0A7W9CC67_9MICO|nr:MFS transporter [Microbacterium ginsengiterrae]MBB5742577.1 MFS family permease [Microbacterium ginsengiterrae]
MASHITGEPPADAGAGSPGNQSKRASLAGFVGSALEYYDMYIYASASALVFSRVFFPDAGSTGLLYSLGLYGVAYLARPLGGFISGHLGDRFGRRNIMILTLLVMGLATFLIGCLPAYDTVGILAPTMLVLLRLCQGLSVGGELAGATSLTLEHAPAGRRSLYTSWAVNGIWVGCIIATFAFIGVAALPEDQLMAWGWRVPFWFSAIILVVGLVIRRTVRDPEAFLAEQEEGGTARVPLAEVLRHQPRDVVRLIFAAFLLVISTTVPVYGLTYATNVAGVPASTTLWAVISGYAVALVTQPLLAALSDRVGRKPVLIGGNLVGGASVWLFFSAVAAADVPLIFTGMILCVAVGLAATNAVYPGYFAELFPVRYRVTGMAVSLQLGLVLTGFSPVIIQAISAANGDAWWPAAAYTTLACLISSVAIASGRETYRVALEDLGPRR